MSRSHELVSVVIPSYNYGRFITDAVGSALAQTYRQIEVVVVDDGSKDDTRERLSSLMGQIRYIYQENAGLSAARNTGIRESKGEWIALLDADDLWHPQKLEVQLQAASAYPCVGLIGSPAASTLAESLAFDPPVRCLSVRDFLLSAQMGPSSALIRHQCLEKVGLFDETLRSVEDRDMWLRLAAHVPCVLVDSPNWWYRPHEGQMSRNAARMFSNYRRVIEKFFREHPQYLQYRRLALGYMHYDAVWPYLQGGCHMKAMTHLIKSAWYRPLSLGDPRKGSLIRSKVALRTACSAVTHFLRREKVDPE